ncbi:MAG: hopanoid biosynthesis-associated protein HpnK, partial [Janthinobacterium lividum]
MKRLIVTADDFGADGAVNEAVEYAHRNGILTAASLMVGAPGMDDAVRRAKRMPALGVGLHLVLVEGRPVLPAERIPGLVDGDGLFRTDMVRAGIDMFFRPAVRRQLAAEIEAQFSAFAATGLRLDHVNAHKHFHLHPTIAWLIGSTGARYGMTTVRAPVEPVAVLRAAAPGSPAPSDWLTAPWAKLVRRRFRRAGMQVPQSVFGLAWSGGMTTERVEGLIANLPEGLSEMYLHPATQDDYPVHGPGYRLRDELAALIDP